MLIASRSEGGQLLQADTIFFCWYWQLISIFLLKTSSSASSSGSKLFDRFVGMGFAEKMVAKAIKENGKGFWLALSTIQIYH